MSDLQTPTSNEINATVDRSSTVLFDAFSNERRQYMLEYLSNYGVVTLDDLSTRLASREKNTSQDHQRQIAISLVHTHLPKLEGAGIVAYNPDLKTVELVAEPVELAPYLALATGHDSGARGR